MGKGINLFTPPFQMNWPALFKAVPKDNDKPDGDKEYRVEAVFPFDINDPRFAEMKKAAHQAMVDEFGADESAWPSGWHNPFRDQKDKTKDGKLPYMYKAGNIFITFKKKYDPARGAPGVVDSGASGEVKEITVADQSKVYSGRWAVADVTAKAYNNKTKGVSFWLNHIQVLDDAHEPWDNRTNAKEVFKPVAKSGEGAGTGGAPVSKAFG